MKQKTARVIALALALVMALSLAATLVVRASSVPDGSSSGTPASSGPSREELQQQLKNNQQALLDLREQIDQLNKDIESGRNAAAATLARKAALEQEAALLEESIRLKQEEIDYKETEIETKIIEISNKQEEFDKSDELLRERLVAIYKMNNSSMLASMLHLDDFSQLLVLMDGLRRISKHDTDLLDKLTREREALEAARADLEVLLAGLEAEREEMDALFEEYQANIAAQNAQYSKYLQQVAADEAAREQAYKDIEEARRAVEQLLIDLGGSVGEYVGGALLWPVPNFNGSAFISSPYGNRILFGRPDFHTGIDISSGGKGGIFGADIVAANSGRVVHVDTSNSRTGYGYFLIIDHGGGIKTLYAHCNSISVSVGDVVGMGQAVATVGNTGNSTGAHLHFELRLNNTQAVDPLPYLNGSKSLE